MSFVRSYLANKALPYLEALRVKADVYSASRFQYKSLENTWPEHWSDFTHYTQDIMPLQCAVFVSNRPTPCCIYAEDTSTATPALS